METAVLNIRQLEPQVFRHFKAEAALHGFSQAEMLRWLMEQAGCLPATQDGGTPAAPAPVLSSSTARE